MGVRGWAGTSLAVQWLRPWTYNAGGTGLIPGWGTKVLHAAWSGPKPIKTKKGRGRIWWFRVFESVKSEHLKWCLSLSLSPSLFLFLISFFFFSLSPPLSLTLMAQSSVLTQFLGQFSPWGGKDGLCRLQLPWCRLQRWNKREPFPQHTRLGSRGSAVRSSLVMWRSYRLWSSGGWRADQVWASRLEGGCGGHGDSSTQTTGSIARQGEGDACQVPKQKELSLMIHRLTSQMWCRCIWKEPESVQGYSLQGCIQ